MLLAGKPEAMGETGFIVAILNWISAKQGSNILNTINLFVTL